MIKIFLYNAHFVYNKSKSKEEQLTYLQFREKVVESFVEPRKKVEGTRPYANFHYLMKIPATEKKKVVMRRCVKCYTDGIRRKSRFMCGFCPDNPVMCVDPWNLVLVRDITKIKEIMTSLKMTLLLTHLYILWQQLVMY